MGVEKTLRSMISAARNVSRYYKLPGRDTVLGPFLDKFFENNIKNQRDKLLNGSDIYGLNFQGGGAIIKYTPLFNILDRRFHLPVSVQNIWTVQVTSQVVTRRMLNMLRRFSLVQLMTLIHRINLWTYIYLMEPVCA